MRSRAAQHQGEACPGEDTLAELIDGGLETGERARVKGHLGGCESCRGAVAGHASLPSERAEEASRLPRGTRVGRYVVQELVGTGAMSTVYAAHDPDLDRLIALKLLRSHDGGDELRARLFREAKAMARLSHPDVITVHDVGAYGALLFVAMELVVGGTLRDWLAREARDWRQVLAVFLRAGRGLACAHAAGLVHRDFKPDNVLVGDDGRVRVTDFGLARGVREVAGPGEDLGSFPGDALDATITRTGALVGTPAYMAPEQLLGASADARSDMFGFSVALYEALYGERPFAGTNIAALRTSTASGVLRAAPLTSPVPEAVREVLVRGLRPRPDDRFPSMDALLCALDASVRGPPAVGDPPLEPLAPAASGAPRLRHKRASGVQTSSVDALAEALLSLVTGSRSAPRSSRWLQLGVSATAAAAVITAGAFHRSPSPETPTVVARAIAPPPLPAVSNWLAEVGSPPPGPSAAAVAPPIAARRGPKPSHAHRAAPDAGAPLESVSAKAETRVIAEVVGAPATASGEAPSVPQAARPDARLGGAATYDRE
jgi:serine/threonine protein kinase